MPPADAHPALADTLREGALAVARTLRDAGFQAVFAGGCVRDKVLGKAPADYDIATDARPDDVLGLFDKCIPVGVQFGVVRVLLMGHEYEVATFRAEASYEDGRRPTDVRWADAREDVLRRDFTINGLLEDPLSGEIIDFVGGRADLDARLVRAIGDANARFSEDYLRLLRCVRFAARLGFQIEASTWAACRALAPSITRISAERIGEELDRIVSQGHAGRGLALLAESGLLGVLLPELSPEDVARAIDRLSHLGVATPLLGWGLALYDRPPLIAALVPRFRWARAFARDLAEATDGAQALARWSELRLADRKRVMRRPTFDASLVIARAAGHRATEAEARAVRDASTPLELQPPPLLSGHDLEALGHRPGKAFKVALDALETAQLEGTATTREEALAVVLPLLMA